MVGFWMRWHATVLLGAIGLPAQAVASGDDPAPATTELYRAALDMVDPRPSGLRRPERITESNLRPAAAFGRRPEAASHALFWQNSPVGRMGQVLDLLREAVASGPLHFRVDWDEMGYDGLREVPEVLPSLSRLTTIYHELLVDIGQPERIPGDLAAVLSTARQSVEGSLLIHYRGALAAEVHILEFLAANLARLPEPVLRELGEALERLPPLPPLREVVDGEAAALRGELWNLLAGVKAGGEQESLPAGNLRVSSIVALSPDDITIGFETPAGESFNLRPGQRRRGYELVTVDLNEGRAILRRGNELFVVELAPRELRPIEIEGGWQRVEEYLRNAGLWYPNIEDIVRRARGDRSVAFHEVLAQFEKDFDVIRTIWKMPVERMPPPSFSSEASFVESTVPLYISTRRLESTHRTRQELLSAAIAHLRNPDGELPASKLASQPITFRRESGRLVFLSPASPTGNPVTLELDLSAPRPADTFFWDVPRPSSPPSP